MCILRFSKRVANKFFVTNFIKVRERLCGYRHTLQVSRHNVSICIIVCGIYGIGMSIDGCLTWDSITVARVCITHFSPVFQIQCSAESCNDAKQSHAYSRCDNYEIQMKLLGHPFGMKSHFPVGRQVAYLCPFSAHSRYAFVSMAATLPSLRSCRAGKNVFTLPTTRPGSQNNRFAGLSSEGRPIAVLGT